MATALILTDDPAEAFHTQQIISELFTVVRACNTVESATAEMSDLVPDLVIVYGLKEFSGQPFKAAAQVVSKTTPAMLMCAGLLVAGVGEPTCSVRVVPPLNLSNTMKAIHELGLSKIVDQSHLNPHSRPAK